MDTADSSRVVLVTGVSRYLGAQVAARLAADPRVGQVIGLDTEPPHPSAPEPPGAGRFEFVRADIRTAEPARVIAERGVGAVVHLAIASVADQHAGGRPAMKELNVIGTMQLLAACQQAPGLRKVVLRSSTAAYGASFRDPAVFTEDTSAREVPRGGFARDVLDMEGYVRGFRRRRPDVGVTVLRFAPFIGQSVSTSLTRYFAQPVVPTVFGRDPRLQFVHVDDALEILHRSVVEDHPGTYNVAGSGVLALSQAVRRAGRIGVPVLEPGMSVLAALARSAGWRDFNLDQLDLFVHGRVVDTRRLVREYGFEPRPTSVAFADFLRGTGAGEVLPHDAVRAAERVLLDGIRQVRAAVLS
ncbi:MAG TPA: NAD-dependent epimerase/dehydratase family protein [Rugosimonospora sp.]|nr:NAD-dependent epimerase/dehydratase family protein [Rugosimonospora sp.]